jgi:HEAT repeat protein
MQKDPQRFQKLLQEWNENQASREFGGYDDIQSQKQTPQSLEHSSYDFSGENSGLTDEIDHKILMHCEAHFAGDFDVMLDYYQQGGIGCHPDIEIERINYLNDVEEGLRKPLASMLLSPLEKEKVLRAKTLYSNFKEVYEQESTKNPLAYVIANLILSEEEEPYDEIEEITELGDRIVPQLIQILKQDDFYDPLFPGYGFAPHLAAQCLGMIGNPKAVAPLFEMFSKELEFDEVVVLEALALIGKPARDFLLNVLRGRPLTSSSVHAAFALTTFSGDLTVATACLEELFDPEVQAKPLLCNYLLCHFDALKGTDHQGRVLELAQSPSLSSQLKGDLHQLVREWD